MTFEQYLAMNESMGIIDFHLRTVPLPDGRRKFYIHAANQSSVTADYAVDGNDLTLLYVSNRP